MQLTVEVPERVPLGGLTVARVAVVNDGTGTVTVSTRFHLHEGDLWLEVDGVRHRGAEQADSQARPAALGPGEAIGSGVSLVATDRGVLFDRSGSMTLMFVYETPTVGRLRSAPVTVQVGGGDPAVDEVAASDLSRGQVEVGMIDPSRNPSRLERIVAAASAVRAGGWSDLDTGDATTILHELLASSPSDEIGWTVSALLPPANDPDDVLLRIARPLVTGDQLALALLDAAPFAASLLPPTPNA